MRSRTTSRFYSLAPSRYPFIPQFFFSPDNGAGEPGGEPSPTPAVNPQPSESAIDQAVERILKSKRADGDAHAALRIAVADAEKQRNRADAAEKSALSKEDRELLDQFKALNLSIADVTKKLEEHTQWGEERARNAKLEGLKKAATAAGLNADVLASLEGALDVEYTVVGEGENAKAIVKVKNGDTLTDKPLADFVNEKWPALKGVLQAGSGTGGAPTVAKYGQSAGVRTGQPAKNEFDAIRERKAAERKQSAASGNWMEEAGVAR